MSKKEGGGGMGWLIAIFAVVLWASPDARHITATLLRGSADFLSPQGRVDSKDSNPKNFTIRNPFYQEGETK